MTARGILQELEIRGATIQAEGGRIRVTAPVGSLPPGLVDRCRAQKAALLGELRGAPAAVSDTTAGDVVGVRQQLGAVLIRSPRFGEVWVALEPSMAPELAAEESGRPNPRPVLLAEDVAKLKGRSDEMIRAALGVLATFPATRVVQ